MFKKYIRRIVNEEINDLKSENTLKQLGYKTYWQDKDESEIKYREFLVNHKNQIIIGLKEENEDLKQENVQLKNTLKGSKNKILELKELYSKEKLDKNLFLSNSYGKTHEIEKLKKELLDSKNGLNGANDIIKNMKQENVKLKEANSDLTEKLFRIESLIVYYESIKPDYYILLELVESIKNILKES